MAAYLDKTGLTYLWSKIKTALAGKQDKLTSGENIKTINNQSILGSGNITITGGGDTSSCVHKTGDETVGGEKTFTDGIAVPDASHILYSGSGGGGGQDGGEGQHGEEQDADEGDEFLGHDDFSFFDKVQFLNA